MTQLQTDCINQLIWFKQNYIASISVAGKLHLKTISV